MSDEPGIGTKSGTDTGRELGRIGVAFGCANMKHTKRPAPSSSNKKKKEHLLFHFKLGALTS